MKIGYACKTTGRNIPEHKELNLVGCKLSAFLKLDESSKLDKLYNVVSHNLWALKSVVLKLLAGPRELRMYRIGSELLPFFDYHPVRPLYDNLRIFQLVCDELIEIGALARDNDVRLSFHPSQFTVIASQNPEVARNGRNTIEHFAEIATLMGYQGWHDHGFCINIHAGSASIDDADLVAGIESLSDTARNFLTLENDEFSWGLNRLLNVAGPLVAIVPDLHHHWIETGGYLLPHATHTIDSIIETWRDTRPKLHLAMSRQHLVEPFFNAGQLPIFYTLKSNGLSETKLRAHSDSPWNNAVIDYARQFGDRFDIMYEGKDKDLGQRMIYERFNEQRANQSRDE